MIVPAGLFVWEVIQFARHRAAQGILFRMVLLTAATVPLVSWYLYLKVHFGVFPAAVQPGNLGVPLVGWFDTLRQAVDLSRSGASHLERSRSRS